MMQRSALVLGGLGVGAIFAVFTMNIFLSFQHAMWSFHDGSRFLADQSAPQQRSPVGLYYINLDQSVERKDYMEEMLKMLRPAGDFKRVRAVDFHEEQEMAELLGPLLNDSLSQHIEHVCRHNRHGEVALTLSHLKAIGQAYQDGWEAAVVFEDDVSFLLVPYWQDSLEDIVAEVSAKDEDWETVRLMFTLSSEEASEEVYWNWKFNNTHSGATQRITNRCCFGEVATLYSRKMIRTLVDDFINLSGRDGPDNDDPGRAFTFNLNQKNAAWCVADIFLPYQSSQHYVATPPLFSSRLAEGSTGVRTGEARANNDKAQAHQNSFLFAFRWVLEAYEMRNSPPTAFPFLRWVAQHDSEQETYAKNLCSSPDKCDLHE